MILAIVGPTAVGKTKMSIALSKIYNGEVINNDSMQIYKGLDVGTAKATKEEMDRVPHHLLSIKEVEENYSVFDYQKDARNCIEDIKSRGKIPVFVGGTGYYLKAALYDYDFKLEDSSLSDGYDLLSNEELERRIQAYESGITMDLNNRVRMIRLLAKLDQGWIPEKNDFSLMYPDVLFIGLTTDRETLYKKIDERFDRMLVPLIDEVKPYIINGIKSKALKTGIGYKEFYDFFDNRSTLQSVVDLCKKNSRNYAKRQYTWFENQMNVKWFSVNYENFDQTIQEVVNYIEENRN